MEEINWEHIGVSNVNASVVEANVLESVQNIKEHELKEKLSTLDKSISDLNSELKQVEQLLQYICVCVFRDERIVFIQFVLFKLDQFKIE